MPPSDHPAGSESLSDALPTAVREVDDFVASAGWDQPPQLFALVPTADLLQHEPALASSLDPVAPLTPVAQESLPPGELATALSTISWPEAVAGCVLTQEIVVLPPEAEAELAGLDDDPDAAARLVAEHPGRREARMVAAVLRGGTGTCLMRIRAEAVEGPEQLADDVIEHAELAPNLLEALRETFRP